MHLRICLTNLLEHPSPLWEEAFGFLVASHCAQTSITSHGRHPTRREKNWPVGKIAPRCEFPISSVALLRANCWALSLSFSLRCARSCCLRSRFLSAVLSRMRNVKWKRARVSLGTCAHANHIGWHGICGTWAALVSSDLENGRGQKKVFHCSFTIRPLEREEGFFSDDHVREINNQVIPSPPRATFANIQVTFRTN